ncbi:uncharacterized protein NEPG_02648 [Nematocida parisii ERTm1]|uniref:uncharacterized protein n=1 Tax=Nematocida parisii (strain ERTm1 / ATCC PRA-289) TaxID=881290 RepID=UPI000264B5EB|nr:uncharacterized protein NEPG_02648 [Nematocida parisii ERTm1]EIJ92488.1 hypothetical protein NEPG_02648 [Nematocida parisii ERTm1]|eukprot:XP_013060475.1 hypothetical protein NEPG_02648 [Nematocida parisii ERTm1]
MSTILTWHHKEAHGKYKRGNSQGKSFLPVANHRVTGATREHLPMGLLSSPITLSLISLILICPTLLLCR